MQLENQKNNAKYITMVRFVINGMFLLAGTICAIVSGYMGYQFLVLLGTDFAKFALFLIIAFECIKIASIFNFEYSKRSRKSKPLSESLSIAILVTRILFIALSCVFFMLTVSAYMDNEQYDHELDKQKREIEESFDKRYAREMTTLENDVLAATEQAKYQMNNIVKGEWKGSRYEESQVQVEKSRKRRDERLEYINYQKDSTIIALKSTLKNDIKSQSKILQGAFNNLTRMGISLEPGSFSARVIWWIGLGISLLVEMTVWLSCATLGSIIADEED